MEGKDWIKNNYGNTFLHVEDVEHESSVMLNEQQLPDEVKDVEACLNEEISNKNRKENKNPWNINKNMHMSMESKKKEQQ